jgi:succinate dehydrogenase/fumarate reductase-like Fe-S protein
MEHNEKEGLIRILRFDPAKEEESEYQDYRVPYQGETVLQVLEHLFEKDDPSLAFRFGCCGSGPARCGACVVEVNDTPVLACQKPAEKEMVLKPHRKFRVIKDLVVDFETERDEA